MEDDELTIVSSDTVGSGQHPIGTVQIGRRIAEGANGAINYIFPVHVEVNTLPADLDADAIADRALERLSDSLADE